MAWTNEQLEAINKSGTNIIVSAGAGSGKTAVLTERVITKLINGTDVNELLILTFTKAAADEMKSRIRSEIEKRPELKEQLGKLSSSYITTFDSFALSIVKKYHYLLNISKNIEITDESLLALQKDKILDEVFDEMYSLNEEEFKNFILKYEIKNDNLIKLSISSLINKLESIVDVDEFLKKIIDNYNDEFINSLLEEYLGLIIQKRDALIDELKTCSNYFNQDFNDKLETSLYSFINFNTINEFALLTKPDLPRLPSKSEEEAKKAKERLKKKTDELLSLNKYGSNENIKNDFYSTKKDALIIVKIIKRYLEKLDIYKKENDIYTFKDIATLSIKVVKENDNVKEELKNYFKEIMIDEYQDTSNMQEGFIKLIENNNVYCVGDIKQSIYRFRGSNPSLFKEKYDNYSANKNGYKIDLTNNFRSREEVVNNINDLFTLLMDNEIGGANYFETHKMAYGNKDYIVNKMEDFNYNMEVLEYLYEEKDYSNTEIEIFGIANDIKNKMKNRIKVFDKSLGTLRDIKYKDFVIILDRSKYFNLYKKIFENLDIPLTILKDGELNSSYDILLLKNIIDFIIRINEKDYSQDYEYDFASIARSFLYEYTDEYIFKALKEKTIKETSIYKDFSNININALSASDLLLKILNITSFYNKIQKIGDYENINVRLESLFNIANTLNNKGINIIEFRDYLEELTEKDFKISYSEFNSGSDSVKIMTIHKSKGLEYPICYFADLDHKFNTSELKDKFILDENYGILVPPTEESDYFLKLLYKNYLEKEELSEKIRLFYVALTRAREKIIIVLPYKEEQETKLNTNGSLRYNDRIEINKLSDMIYASKPYISKYFKNLDIKDINLSKSYLYQKSKRKDLDETTEELIVNEINIESNILEDKHFSKTINKIISKEEHELLTFGTKVHETLEYIDFNNPDLSSIKDNFIKSKIEKFLSSDILKDIDKCKYYQEYEFYYEIDNANYHGIIDLMIERENSIDIVDYKLKNVVDENYIKQLTGYKNYISTISNKKIKCYLYSILDEKITEITI